MEAIAARLEQYLHVITGGPDGTLGGAYFMLAARALGLDCGPMSGFDPAKVDQAFFASFMMIFSPE